MKNGFNDLDLNSCALIQTEMMIVHTHTHSEKHMQMHPFFQTVVKCGLETNNCNAKYSVHFRHDVEYYYHRPCFSFLMELKLI